MEGASLDDTLGVMESVNTLNLNKYGDSEQRGYHVWSIEEFRHMIEGDNTFEVNTTSRSWVISYQ